MKPTGHRSRSFYVKGDFLRTMRASRGWTQEEAAKKAGYTDRLIRKAESSGPLEIQSIAILAELYSTEQRRLTPGDLLAQPVPNCDAFLSPSEARAVTLVRRLFEEVWNQRRFETIDELLPPDCVHHAEGNVYRGREAFRQRASAVHSAFSEVHIDIEEMTVHHGVVICRWHATFRHTGPFFGIPPTGKRHAVRASTWVRFEDGVLVEGWDYWDQQLIDVVKPQ